MGKWVIGVGVLAFALSSAVATAQTPTPDPAPAPAPAPPPPLIVEPAPEPEPEAAPKHAPTAGPKTEQKRPAGPLALRMARLHPPLVENAPYTKKRTGPATDFSPLSNVRLTGSDSESPPIALALLLVLGATCAAFIVLGTVPQRLMSGAPPQLVHHRGELAVGGFAILVGLAIGVLIPVLLQ